jgi:hypothetical protein
MAQTKIDEKFASLKAAGFDLGPANGLEQSAGYGGTFRSYKNGNIYWHPVMGDSAHEVHGGILTLYLANGGPGVNPKTGVREFGFPLSDELKSPGDLTPYSAFETGAIYWTQGTGGVVMYGDIYAAFHKIQASGVLGLPISNQLPAATGQAVFFERGVLWTSAAIKGNALYALLEPPLIGQPSIVGTSGVELRNVINWPGTQNDLSQKLPLLPPTTLSDVWDDRLFLAPVGGGAEIPLKPSMTALSASLEIPLTAAGALQDSKLYDLHLHTADGHVHNLSPHAVYAKNSWENFGLLHATDIHLSLRNEKLRAKLAKAGLPDASAHYANFQDNFRDLIKYANHLHSLGLADVLIGTGDLIDYIIEPGDNPYSGNFERFRRMLMGQPFDAGVAVGEELQIPVFLTFGNHDYRMNPYDLSIHIKVGIGIDGHGLYVEKYLDEYSSHNLTPEEALKAQGGDKEYGISNFKDATAMYAYDTTGAAYKYFTKYMGRQRTFVVALGANRLAILDTLYDAGVPVINGYEDLAKFFAEYELNDFSTATSRLLNNCGDIEGLSDPAYQALKPALDEAGANGVVIVGMHVPPFSPLGDYPYYFRETVHPIADPKLTQEYISRNKVKSDGWSLTGTPYFRTGEIGNGHGLDNGVISEHGMDFLRLCTGLELGVTRPIDLLLCGHHHDRTEYRMTWNGSALNFFMDFYLEEPATYYSTINGYDVATPAGTVPKGSRLAIKIDPHAPAAGHLTAEVIHQGAASEVRGTIAAPPYATPLDTAADTKAWWEAHRPILAQTAALGPIDPRQRFDPLWKKNGSSDTVEAKTQPSGTTQVVTQWPEPTFNGFRLVQVQGNVIHKVRYITLAELRRLNFRLPWEVTRILPFPVTPIRAVTAATT